MARNRSEVIVIVGQGLVGGLLDLSLVLSQEVQVDLDLGGSQRGSGNEVLIACISLHTVSDMRICMRHRTQGPAT